MAARQPQGDVDSALLLQPAAPSALARQGRRAGPEHLLHRPAGGPVQPRPGVEPQQNRGGVRGVLQLHHHQHHPHRQPPDARRRAQANIGDVHAGGLRDVLHGRLAGDRRLGVAARADRQHQVQAVHGHDDRVRGLRHLQCLPLLRGHAAHHSLHVRLLRLHSSSALARQKLRKKAG